MFARYQIGVFLSRSSGSVFELDLSSLPWLAVFQFGLMFFFIAVSALEVSGSWLLVPAFVTGIFGGLCYVNAFRILAHDSPPAEREKNMALTSTADSLGVGCADLFGILLQRLLS
jgi:battenin